MMKRTLLLLIAGASLSLSAQQGTAWVAGHLGQTIFESKTGLKDQVHYGVGVGHWYTNRWGLDLRALTNSLEQEAPGTGKSKEAHLLPSALFNFRPGADNWYPYAAAGLGASVLGSGLSPSHERTVKLNLHGGLGIMGRPTENVLLDVSAKAVRINLPTARTEYLATVGLGYTWGGVKKAVAVPPPAPEPTPMPIPPPAPAPQPEVKPEPVAPPPPPPAPEVAKPVPPPPPPPAKIVLDEAVLHFANGKADLSADATAAIVKVADGLKAYKGDYTLEVSGHTSSVGGKALNKALAKRRADAVAKILIDAGIPAARVTTVGVGPDKPLADNASKEGQAKNRRVEIDVKVKDGHTEVRKTETGVVEATLPAPTPRKPEKKSTK